MIYFSDAFVGLDCEEKWRIMLKPEDGVVYMGKSVEMQFIGLQDREDEDIYEGDILLFDKYKYMVYWFEEMATFQLVNIEGGMDDYFEAANNSVMEIVGNIFENPELLDECT